MKIKPSIYVLLLLFCTSVAYSQEVEEAPTQAQDLEEVTNERTFYKVVDSMPRFPGCEDKADDQERKACADLASIKHLYGNISYPAEARKNGTEGTVHVSFVVEADGTLTSFRIDNDPGDGCGAEALRVFQTMPDWVPGMRNGEAVAVQMSYPVKFRLGR